MNQFVAKYRDEVKDYVERLESGLLALEREPANMPVCAEVFRILHSMKGSGGMFGFNLLSDVMHDMESLFELFRSGKCLVDSEVIAFSLRVLDGMDHLMVLKASAEDQQFAELVKNEAKAHVKRLSESSVAVPEMQPQNARETSALEKESTFYVSFLPNEELLENGTNPLYLIDELNALGQCNVQVSFDRLPAIADIDPTKCYISWDVFIATEESIDTLNDVFIFVTGDAEIIIEKVGRGNLIGKDAVLAGFLNAKSNGIDWDCELLAAGPGNSDTPIANSAPGAIEKQEPIFSTQNRVDSVKVDAVKIDRYMNLISEIVIAQSRLEDLSAKLKEPELEKITETYAKIGRQLRENAFDMSLIPLQSITRRFERLVHDLSKSLDKEVNLVTDGMETELDKTIIEKLMEPLLHLVRNSLDHGIENKAERARKNKNQAGKVSIKAGMFGADVRIHVEDDGRGIDAEKVREKAVNLGIINENDDIKGSQLLNLIFTPGFSTAGIVTDVSGRGVGMDIVKKSIQEMGGTVDIATEKDQFTRTTITFPISLSIIDAFLVKVGADFYVIPSSIVRKIVSVESASFSAARGEFIYEERLINYYNLNEIFNSERYEGLEQIALVVESDGQFFGIVVDSVLREFQAVVKPVSSLVKEMDLFSGVTVLGSGELALVINAGKLNEKSAEL